MPRHTENEGTGRSAPRRTREQWLQKMTELLRPAFKRIAKPLPEKLRVSCGWPSSGGLAKPSSKSRTLGQCWPAACSADGSTEVFLSPAVAEAGQAAAILVHELCHAAISEPGHGPAFKAIATKMGLEGKMTATTASPELTKRLNALITQVGRYPHATLDQTKSGIKKQGTRLIKLTCQECGYTVRATRTWIDVGLPTCPCEAGAELTEEE